MQQTRNTISASALLNFGDTYVLGGLVEKEADFSESGTPVLKDIPLLQVLFKRSVKSDFSRQILTLITVRRVVDSESEVERKAIRNGDISTHQMSKKVAEFLADNPNKQGIDQTLKALIGDGQPYPSQLRAKDGVNTPAGDPSNLKSVFSAMTAAGYL